MVYAKAQLQVQTQTNTTQTLQNLEPIIPLFSLETLFDRGTCQTYTVKSGDTMWKIAKQHGLALNALPATNYIANPNFIRPGDTIYLPPLNCFNKIDPDKYDDVPRVPLKSMYPQTLPPLALPQPPRDPLAFDLNRDGIIETVALTQELHFDFNGDGFKEATTWVGKNDGLLVLDRDQNGSIDDGRELFGGDTILKSGHLADNGFLALKELDTNPQPDAVIDDKDTCFSALRIWRDDNQNAIAESGELHPLSDLGIDSIHLSYQSSDHVDKNKVAHRELGTFTWTDGYSGKMACLWFNVDKRLTIPVQHTQGTLEIPEDIRRLPNVRGYGTVRSLHEAMVLDKSGELKAMVKAYVNTTHTTEIRYLLHAIIFRWTGQENIVQNSRGEHIDARSLGALEALCGEKIPIQEPNLTYAETLWEQYMMVASTIYYQLSSQHPWNWLFEQVRFTEDPQTLKVNADFSAFIPHCQTLFQYLRKEDAVAIMVHQMKMFDGIRPFDNAMDLQFLEQVYPTLKQQLPEDLEAVVFPWSHMLSHEDDTIGCGNFITRNPYKHFLYGVEGNDTLRGCDDFDMLFGGTGNDKLYGAGGNDGLFGGMGDDILEGGDGADILSGNSGNDILKGGMGSDTYRFGRGSGVDIIIEDQSAPGDIDVLKFAPDVLNEQLWFRQVDNNLDISVIGTNSKITIQDWTVDKVHRIEQFKTDDGSTLLESQVDALISAMAAFAPPSMGETSLPPNYQTVLTPILATSWENGLR